jgi:hypothetical protein
MMFSCDAVSFTNDLPVDYAIQPGFLSIEERIYNSADRDSESEHKSGEYLPIG